jgi:hypothetical protein
MHVVMGWIRAGGVTACLALALGVVGGAGARAAGPVPDVLGAPAAPATQTSSPLTGFGTRLPWKAAAGKGGPRLLWTGFRSLPDGHGAEIWLQTSGSVEAETLAQPAGAILRLKGCRSTLRRTDALPLETRYFASSVSRVTVERHGHDLDVRVGMQGPGAVGGTTLPASRREAGPDGSFFWVFSFTAPPAPRSPAPGPTASAVP